MASPRDQQQGYDKLISYVLGQAFTGMLLGLATRPTVNRSKATRLDPMTGIRSGQSQGLLGHTAVAGEVELVGFMLLRYQWYKRGHLSYN